MQRHPEPEYMDLPEEADAYAEADFSEVNEAFVARLVKLAGVRKNVTALELGTGPGDITIRLAQQRPDWHVVATDASFAMLQIASAACVKGGVASRICPVLGDAKRLPCTDRSFDIVFSNSIIHHINEIAEFWAEVKRLACPGAFVFMRDLVRPGTPQAARAIVDTYAGTESPLLQEEFYRSLLAAYTVEEIEAQLKAVGVRGLRVERVTDRHLDVYGTIA